jgi:hypothetical protein
MIGSAGTKEGDLIAFGHTLKPWHRLVEGVHLLNTEIEQKILNWLDDPDTELERLRVERERKRRERLEAERRKAVDRGVSFAVPAGSGHSGATYLVRPEVSAS